ncbi:M48 family peptidase, partial [Campylobacter lari]|nr:M48 family peptidase [Campylobacter lari]
MTLITILCFYTFLMIYISYHQINFIKKEKVKQAVILDKNDYENAANIAIENEKYKIFSNIYNLIINIVW